MEFFITSYCITRKGKISLNGEPWLSTPETGPNEFCKAIYQKLGIKYPKFFKMDNLSKLAFVTSELLLQDTDWHKKYRGEEVGIIISNFSSSLDTDTRFQESMKEYPSPSLFVYTLPNILVGEISIRNKIMGENAFFIFAQFDAPFMCDYVNDLLDQGYIKACLMGWVDVFEDNYESFLFFIEKEKPKADLSLICNPETVIKLIKGYNVRESNFKL